MWVTCTYEAREAAGFLSPEDVEDREGPSDSRAHGSGGVTRTSFVYRMRGFLVTPFVLNRADYQSRTDNRGTGCEGFWWRHLCEIEPTISHAPTTYINHPGSGSVIVISPQPWLPSVTNRPKVPIKVDLFKLRFDLMIIIKPFTMVLGSITESW